MERFSKIAKTIIAVMLLVAFIPTSVSATKAPSGTEKTSYRFDCVGSRSGVQYGYLFEALNGSAAGARGTCVDNWAGMQSDGTHTGYVKKVSNNDAVARVAYYFYKNGIDPGSKGNWRGMTESMTAHACMIFARCYSSEVSSGRTVSQEKSKMRSLAMQHIETRLSITQEAMNTYKDTPANFEVYYLWSNDSNQDAIVWKEVPVGSVQLHKQSSNSATPMKVSGYNSFSGIEYTLYKSDKKTVVGTLKCQANGYTNVISNLPIGTYYAKETKTNAYYKLNSEWRTCAVTENKTTTVLANDYPNLAKIRVQKVDLSGQPLEGTFTFKLVHTQDASKTKTITIKGNGKSSTITSDWVDAWAGTYKVTEITCPSTYENVTKSAAITVGPNKTGTVKWNNRLKPAYIKVQKSDKNKKPLKGTFKFKIVNTKTSKSYEITIKGDGKNHTITSAPIQVVPGSYKITETSFPADYKNITKTASGTVAATKTLLVKWENRSTLPGSATLKKAGKNKLALSVGGGYSDYSGIEYTLYKADKKTSVGTFTVKKDGTSNTISNLEPGTYYAKETKANAYYEINPDYVTAVIKENALTTINAQDDPEFGAVKITKKEAEGNSMPKDDKFTFTLVNTKNASVKYTLEVTANGSTTASATKDGIIAGTYRVAETNAPDAYIDVTGGATVTITPNKTSEVEYKNELPQENELYVLKTTEDGGTRAGFKFKVTGVLFNNGKLTAEDFINAANPVMESEEYTLEDWVVDADDLKALNEAAKNGEADSYEVKMTNNAKPKSAIGYERTSDETPVEGKTYYAKTDEAYVEASLTVNPKEEGWHEVGDEEYILTADTVAVDGKTYYTKNGDEYVKATSIDDLTGLYEKNENNYKLTEDTAVADGKTYYTMNDGIYKAVEEFSVSPSRKGWYEKVQVATESIEIKVNVVLDTARYVASEDKYISEIGTKTPNSKLNLKYTISWDDFNWLGAATRYVDVHSNEEFTVLTTDSKGKGVNPSTNKPGIMEGIAPGRYTVEEVMTDEQLLRYRQPAVQTKEIHDEENASLSFKFVNNANWTEIKLHKTSPDNKIDGVMFRVVGKTVFGEDVEVTGVTDDEGNVSFGKLHAGEYVVEETSFDGKKYINNHPLNGYTKPAIGFNVTGEEKEPITIEFDNLPRTALYLTKVDGSSYGFLENAEFELYEGDNLVASFQVVANDDGSAGINMKMTKGEITGSMVKTLQATDTNIVDIDEGDVIATSGTKEEINKEDIDLETLNWAKLENLDLGKTYTLKEVRTPSDKYVRSTPKTFVFENPTRIVVENYVPEIGTTALDAETGSHAANADDSVIIKDTVEYKHLYPGEEYLMKGSLVKVNDSGDVESLDATAEKKFIASDTGNGTIELEFTLNATELAGFSAVVYEECYQFDAEGETKLLVSHKDPGDEKQTVRFPKVGTQADRATDGANHKITDTVTLENLVMDQEYTLKGVLVDKATGNAMKDGEGNDVTTEKTFKADARDMEVTMEFEFTNEDMLGKVGVVFEELLVDSKVVGSHKDVEDEKQTVKWPNPGYNMWKVRNEDAPKKAGTDKYGFAWGTTVTYTGYIANTGDVELMMDVTDAFDEPDNFSLPVVVAVENAVVNSRSDDGNLVNITIAPGRVAKVIYSATINDDVEEYLAADKADSDSLDESGKDCNRTDKANTPDDEDGYVNVIKTENVKYKDPKDPGTPWKDFPGKQDEAQTPVQGTWIKTNAIDSETGDHISFAGKDVIIKDIVTYGNVVKGRKYLLSGILMDKSTGKPFMVDGKVITSEIEFVPDKESGSEEVLFRFDATGLDGTELVAFEELKAEGKLIASHRDIEDKGQTVVIPKIGTTAAIIGEDVVDIISYEKLLDATYVANGYLVDEATGKKIPGTDAEKRFKASGDGEVEVTIHIPDIDKLRARKLVVFEEVYIVESNFGKEELHIVASHKDRMDKNQTVTVPKIGTTALDANTNDHIAFAGKDTVIKDSVRYEGLTEGKEYILKGVLMDKKSGKAVKVDGKEVTAEKKFIPKEVKGSEIIEFKFDATTLEGKTVVAFEELYLDGVLADKHKDITDKEQTVIIPKVRTTAALQGKEVSDIVSVENIIKGQTYIVKGFLVDSESGQKLKGSDGEVKFKAEETAQKVTVKLPISSIDRLGGRKLVAFEELYIVKDGREIIVGAHRDITDKNQTVKIPVKSPKTGDTNHTGFYIGLMAFTAISAAMMHRKRRFE